jgi:hypothetical protein
MKNMKNWKIFKKEINNESLDIKREKEIDKAYKLMTLKADILEHKFGERTQVDVLKEGKILFSYKVWFCDDNDKITTRIINISIK